MDKDVCPCGKASVEYEVIGEDAYTAKMINAKARKAKYCYEYICESCGEVFSEADRCMVVKNYKGE